MKKTLAVLLAATMMTLAGCSGGSKPVETEKASETEAQVTEAQAAESQTDAQKEAASAEWPSGQLTIYVPAKAGAGTDLQARIFAQYVQKSTGKAATVVNQPDGGGTIAFESVRNAKPDGNTLLFYHSNLLSAYWTGTYDHTYDEFTNICTVTDNGSQAFVAAPNAPYNNLKELVEYAKANPESVKTGVQIGGGSHITMAVFEQAADIKLKMVEAGSNSDKLAGLAGGHIDFTVQDLMTAKQYEEAGKLKIVAVGTKSEKYPEYESCEEQGYPEIGQRTLYLLHGPLGMDQSVIDAINECVKNMADDEESKEALDKIGAFPAYGDQKAAQDWMKEESDRYNEQTSLVGTNARK